MMQMSLFFFLSVVKKTYAFTARPKEALQGVDNTCSGHSAITTTIINLQDLQFHIIMGVLNCELLSNGETEIVAHLTVES
jgi:hypothetical protein